MEAALSRTARSLVDDPKHGAMPVLLLALTVLTGVIDAVSILSLGRVFVANMTGNVVFVGFALVGIPGFSLSASLFALVGFLVGAFAAGAIVPRVGGSRGALLRGTVLAELVIVTIAMIIAITAGRHAHDAAVDAMAAVCALAMGVQNTVVRRLAVPDLTTTVLTMTLTGLAADVPAGAEVPVIVRRVLAVSTMLVGAIIGAVLVRDHGAQGGLILAVAILAAVAAASMLLGRRLSSIQ
ncbi:MAG TPA: YoaK family protein [Jatrophihabitantaceae bacterium]|jgi:uncharacterized membrane protein YoaK (UPF0700 family)